MGVFHGWIFTLSMDEAILSMDDKLPLDAVCTTLFTVSLMGVGTLPFTRACYVCLLNKPFCDWKLPGCVEVMGAVGRSVFVVGISHFLHEQ